ncbi:MAG: hypothetical protein HZA90_13355 [Verrucomicrobia bacterium]|nr:hypothetical protein [Verrucomicrobiota bacterium]
MTESDLREIFDLAREREQKVYAWLRYLIGLASGALTVLVALQDKLPPTTTGIALVALKAAWVALGSGILLGAVSLFGEIRTAREMVNLLVKQKSQPEYHPGDPPSPILVPKLPILKWSERLCYCSLVVAVVSLVAFALARR